MCLLEHSSSCLITTIHRSNFYVNSKRTKGLVSSWSLAKHPSSFQLNSEIPLSIAHYSKQDHLFKPVVFSRQVFHFIEFQFLLFLHLLLVFHFRFVLIYLFFTFFSPKQAWDSAMMTVLSLPPSRWYLFLQVSNCASYISSLCRVCASLSLSLFRRQTTSPTILWFVVNSSVLHLNFFECLVSIEKERWRRGNIFFHLLPISTVSLSSEFHSFRCDTTAEEYGPNQCRYFILIFLDPWTEQAVKILHLSLMKFPISLKRRLNVPSVATPINTIKSIDGLPISSIKFLQN